MSEVKRPLEGVKVLELATFIAAPCCARFLADLGAEVIKVEKPGTGDDSRGYGPFVNGQSGYFVSVNHGKKSVVYAISSGECWCEETA